MDQEHERAAIDVDKRVGLPDELWDLILNGASERWPRGLLDPCERFVARQVCPLWWRIVRAPSSRWTRGHLYHGWLLVRGVRQSLPRQKKAFMEGRLATTRGLLMLACGSGSGTPWTPLMVSRFLSEEMILSASVPCQPPHIRDRGEDAFAAYMSLTIDGTPARDDNNAKNRFKYTTQKRHILSHMMYGTILCASQRDLHLSQGIGQLMRWVVTMGGTIEHALGLLRTMRSCKYDFAYEDLMDMAYAIALVGQPERDVLPGIMAILGALSAQTTPPIHYLRYNDLYPMWRLRCALAIRGLATPLHLLDRLGREAFTVLHSGLITRAQHTRAKVLLGSSSVAFWDDPTIGTMLQMTAGAWSLPSDRARSKNWATKAIWAPDPVAVLRPFGSERLVSAALSRAVDRGLQHAVTAICQGIGRCIPGAPSLQECTFVCSTIAAARDPHRACRAFAAAGYTPSSDNVASIIGRIPPVDADDDYTIFCRLLDAMAATWPSALVCARPSVRNALLRVVQKGAWSAVDVLMAGPLGDACASAHGHCCANDNDDSHPSCASSKHQCVNASAGVNFAHHNGPRVDPCTCDAWRFWCGTPLPPP